MIGLTGAGGPTGVVSVSLAAAGSDDASGFTIS